MDIARILLARENASFGSGKVSNAFFAPSERGVGFNGSITYNADRLVSGQNCEFVLEPRFRAAYEAGMATAVGYLPPGSNLEWRVHVACWAASTASHLNGDFVECGVNTGVLMTAILRYLRPEQHTGRKIWLFDTFCGIPTDGLDEVSLQARAELNSVNYRRDVFAQVQQQFAAYPHVQLVRGAVPQTLATAPIERVGFLSLDMNVPEPEVAALRHFWDRLVPGALVLLDDYAWFEHMRQKRALDALSSEFGVEILTLPTGQGLLIRP